MTDETARHPPRFSLRSLVVAITFVAMAIALWQLYIELAPLRSEVARLRNEVGELSVEDDSKLHAIEIPQRDEFTWKWRVWIPAGRKYELLVRSENIPKEGLPMPEGTITISEFGEMWVMYRIARDPRDNTWRGSTSTRTGSVGSDQHDWVEWGSRVSTDEGVNQSTLVGDPAKPLVLARKRVSKTVTSSQNIEDPAAGFMIWLNPIP